MSTRSSYKQIPENTSKNTHPTVLRLLLEEEPQVRKVLDIPCGAGAFTLRLLERGKEVYAGDIENLLQVDAPRFYLADMNRRLPFEDAYFDAVVSVDGIEHLERPFDFVTEAARILRKGGVLIVSTPNISALRSRWRFLLTGHHNKGKTPLDELRPSPLHHISLLTFPALRYMLHRSGLVIEKIAANRMKLVSLGYGLLVPFAFPATFWVYAREEKDPLRRARNYEIMKQVFSPPVLFGETIILKARRM